MNYKFSNLLGAPYRGGSILFDGDSLLCPAGNRVRDVALRAASSQTYPFQHSHQVQTIALSPDGTLLLTIDTSGRALLVLRSTRVLLHRFSLNGTCTAAKFSPDGRFVAIAVGKILQVWHTPPKKKMVSPMQLHRKYGGCFADIVDIAWSSNSQFIAVASKDITARLFSLHPISGFVPPTLTGHRASLVSIFFLSPESRRSALVEGQEPADLFTISSDGALHAYTFLPDATAAQKRPREAGSADNEDASEEAEEASMEGMEQEKPRSFAHGKWQLSGKQYFMQHGATLMAADYHGATGLLVTVFSSGCFLLHQLPAFEHLQKLSVSHERINAVSFNANSEWIALGAAAPGQLLVWEWRSETYVLKQQGHYYDVNSIAFSPDGTYLVSGADDAKLKVWLVSSGFCFVTFTEHTAPITAVVFSPSSHAIVSASLDGTVRAFDLVRYRNFRTFATPEPVQFGCVAIDGSGEVICAGTRDSFQVCTWNMRTGQLLDLLSGHEAPIVGLSFNPSNSTLASACWDNTVRLWGVFSSEGSAGDVLQHTHEVLAVAFDPTGKQLCTSTLNGELHFWDAHEAVLLATIEARRDVRRGRLMTDRRAAGNMASGQAFTSLAYSADGSFVIAAGNCKWVCVYDTSERVLLRRFQLSKNLALDGVLDQANSRNLTDAGPLDLLDADDDEDEAPVLPPAAAGSASAADKLPGTTGRQRKAVLRCQDLALAQNGNTWAAATTEGILMYSLSSTSVFDPTDLAEDVSVPSVHRLIGQGAPLKALLMATRLSDDELIRHVLMTVPSGSIRGLAAVMPPAVVVRTFAALAGALVASPHLQYVITWLRALCEFHGSTLSGAPRVEVLPAVRELHRGLEELSKHLAPSVASCLYSLAYLSVVSSIPEADDSAAR